MIVAVTVEVAEPVLVAVPEGVALNVPVGVALSVPPGVALNVPVGVTLVDGVRLVVGAVPLAVTLLVVSLVVGALLLASAVACAEEVAALIAACCVESGVSRAIDGVRPASADVRVAPALAVPGMVGANVGPPFSAETSVPSRGSTGLNCTVIHGP